MIFVAILVAILSLLVLARILGSPKGPQTAPGKAMAEALEMHKPITDPAERAIITSLDELAEAHLESP